MKKKSIRILSIVAVIALTLTVASSAFAANVSTSTQYIVGADNINRIQVDTNITNATAASLVSYLVTAGTNAEPSSSNVLYMNQYEVDAAGTATISYKLDKTSANFPADYTSTVRFGSTAENDTFTGTNLEALVNYRAYYNADGSVNFLPIEGKEIDTISINGTPVANSLALTQEADEGDLISVTTKNLTSGAVGDDKMASAYTTIDSTNSTVNVLFQPVAGSGITEIGIKYGELLFPSLAELSNGDPFIGITNVKLDFSTAIDASKGYTFAGEAAKCVPYYLDENGDLYYYDSTAEDFVAGTLED
jgi:hypothetical protein